MFPNSDECGFYIYNKSSLSSTTTNLFSGLILWSYIKYFIDGGTWDSWPYEWPEESLLSSVWYTTKFSSWVPDLSPLGLVLETRSVSRSPDETVLIPLRSGLEEIPRTSSFIKSPPNKIYNEAKRRSILFRILVGDKLVGHPLRGYVRGSRSRYS